ncbi:NPP1 family protein [Clavibacter sp. Sh2126]|uniref:NPP1 family protein n=1 Tax=Clavibacter sp. Sh2126 TaxID=3397678 RepID=UPI0039DFE030
MSSKIRRTDRTTTGTRSRTGWRGAAAALGALALVVGPAAAAHADPPSAIPAAATEDDARWQPATDYDGEGCYPTPAMDAAGTPAEGLSLGGANNGNCRDQSDLDNVNSYARTTCVADGWCAHAYAYYFEKDQRAEGVAGDGNGHRHDLEHVIVWVKDGEARYVSASAHGGYDTRAAADVLWEDTHPKIVYHKDGPHTHAMRFASGDDEPAENHYGTWQRPALLSWDLMSDAVRGTINTHSYGSATFDIKDDRITSVLSERKPESSLAF